jgi:predicted metalloenzyme YecM
VREIIGDYETFIAKADALVAEHNIAPHDLIQCDTICYRVETNERYDEIKRQLAECALMIDETEVNGRLISVFAPDASLSAGKWPSISYIEIPQPKPGSPYPEGIDHVQMVTRRSLSDFQKQYPNVEFEEKGLANKLNPLLKLTSDDTSVKFHDKHMGAVIELENRLH